MPGIKDQRFAVQHKPDWGEMRTTILTNRCQLASARPRHQKLMRFI